MRQLTVTDAKREAAKARVALSGPPGAGKTWTALRIARVLSPEGTILFVDTEHESAKLYAPPFVFKHAAWEPPYNAKELTEAIYHYAAHVDVLIVDSLSHFWIGEGGVLEVAGGKFTGWKEARPIQRAMVDAIVRAPCHFIGCMRSKVEFTQEYDERLKKQVVTRLGTADMQSDDMPYEFTVAAELDQQHRLTITKTRCADLDGRVYAAHREVEMAETLLGWLNAGEPVNGRVDPELEQALAADTKPKQSGGGPSNLRAKAGQDPSDQPPDHGGAEEREASAPPANVVLLWFQDRPDVDPKVAARELRFHDKNAWGTFTDRTFAMLTDEQQQRVLAVLMEKFPEPQPEGAA